MPIKINLLAETLAAEDMRRRDPVKRCIFGGVFLVVLALVWFSAKLAECMLANEKLTQVQSEIDQHTNEFSMVESSLKKIADAKGKLAALQKLSDDRFLQGTLLNALQQTAPVPGVQLTHLRVDQAYLYTEGTPPQNSGGRTIPGRPPTVVEKIVLSMDARDYSANPGDQVNKFKQAVVKQPYFQATLDTNGVTLVNLSAPQNDPNGKPYVLFTMECRYPDQYR
jgi:uncharacterized protein YihD (DUF1040 family)